jgi:hypothetical protein
LHKQRLIGLRADTWFFHGTRKNINYLSI